MDPLSEPQVHDENRPDEDNQFGTDNNALVPDCVPQILDNGGQSSNISSTPHVTNEQREVDKQTAARDPFSMPLVITKVDGMPGVLWAILDTGASYNFITRSLVDKLGLLDKLQSTDPEINITTGDGKTTTIKHCLYLTFHARHDERCYTNVEFLVEQEDRVEDAKRMDHIPHLFMGLPWMREHHVLMLDEKFATTRFDDLEAIEPKPEHEHGFYGHSSGVTNAYMSRGGASGTFSPQKPSVPLQNPLRRR